MVNQNRKNKVNSQAKKALANQFRHRNQLSFSKRKKGFRSYAHLRPAPRGPMKVVWLDIPRPRSQKAMKDILGLGILAFCFLATVWVDGAVPGHNLVVDWVDQAFRSSIIGKIF